MIYLIVFNGCFRIILSFQYQNGDIMIQILSWGGVHIDSLSLHLLTLCKLNINFVTKNQPLTFNDAENAANKIFNKKEQRQHFLCFA